MSVNNGLPVGWTYTTLGEISINNIDKSGPKNVDSFVYVDISSIDNEKKQIVEPNITPTAEAPSRAKQHLQVQDVVVSMTRPNLNAVAIVPPQMDGAIGSTGLHILRSTAVNPHYIYYWVQTQSFVRSMTDLVLGVLYPAVRPDDIRDSKMPLAPLPEQHRIVEEIEKQFSRLDAGVAALKRVQANLKRYRASVLKAACDGRLVPTEAELARQEGRDYEPAEVLLQRILVERRKKWEESELAKMRAKGKEPKDDNWKAKYKEPAAPDSSDLPELPEGWGWATAEQLCDFITKGTTPSADKLFSGKGEIPYIKVYNLTDRGVLNFKVNPTFISTETHAVELARSKILPNDVLMNLVGPPLGKVSIVPDTYPEWNTNQAVAIFHTMPSFSHRFLAVCLLTESILKWAISRTKTTAGQVNLTLEISRDLPIPIPPLAEQYRIVEEVERRLSVLEQLETAVELNLKRAEKLRQAILKQAFEGKLVGPGIRPE